MQRRNPTTDIQQWWIVWWGGRNGPARRQSWWQEDAGAVDDECVATIHRPLNAVSIAVGIDAKWNLPERQVRTHVRVQRSAQHKTKGDKMLLPHEQYMPARYLISRIAPYPQLVKVAVTSETVSSYASLVLRCRYPERILMPQKSRRYRQ